MWGASTMAEFGGQFDWQALLQEGIEEKENQRIRRHEWTGWPLGDEDFINKIENSDNRILHKQKPGLKKWRVSKWVICIIKYSVSRTPNKS